jgi:predicted nuclease of predicted toxin-antitoxin system
MALLVDNNLSPRVAELLQLAFPKCSHVASLGMDKADDAIVWNHAKNHGFCILTKDNDFEAMSRLYGCPPKVIQLTCGNRKTSEIMSILRSNNQEIDKFLRDAEDCLMYLG